MGPLGLEDSDEAQFGFIKGRDRAVLAIILLETQEHQRWTKAGFPAWLLSMDVKSAFPKSWRPAVAYEIAKGGMSDKLWALLRAMERGLRGYVWVQDLKTEEYAYKDGMNQGDPTAPEKWIWFIDPLYPTIRESMEGADLQNGATVKTAGFADDTFLVSSGPRALQDLAAGGRACESDA